MFLKIKSDPIPLNELGTLRSDDNVARSWKTGNVDRLLSEAKVSEEQTDDQSVGMTNAC